MMKMQGICSVLVLAAAGLLSSVSPAQAADYKAIIRCMNPSTFMIGTVDIAAEDDDSVNVEETFLSCDKDDPTDNVVLSSLPGNVVDFDIDTDVIHFGIGLENNCEIETNSAEGDNDGINKRHLDQCFLSSSKTRYVQVQVLECGNGVEC